MTKAGEKLLSAAREALGFARCEHDWSMPERDGVVSRVMCRRCGVRVTYPHDRTTFDPRPSEVIVREQRDEWDR